MHEMKNRAFDQSLLQSYRSLHFTLEFSVKTDNSVEEIYSNLHYLLLLACNTSVKILGLVICFYCICSGLHLVLTSVVSFSCIMGALRNPSAPIPHDSLQYYIATCTTCGQLLGWMRKRYINW